MNGFFLGSATTTSTISGFNDTPEKALIRYILYFIVILFVLFRFNTTNTLSPVVIDCSNGKVGVDKYNTSLFALHDITQVNIKVQAGGHYGVNFKQIYADLDTISPVVEYSSCSIEPDERTQSRIVYTSHSKIEKIKKEGLYFKARFPELQNKQTIRVVFISLFLPLLLRGIIINIKALTPIINSKRKQKKD